jgi:hypothetical protein
MILSLQSAVALQDQGAKIVPIETQSLVRRLFRTHKLGSLPAGMTKQNPNLGVDLSASHESLKSVARVGRVARPQCRGASASQLLGLELTERHRNLHKSPRVSIKVNSDSGPA